ncbi:unnamed protein product [Clavelina lepadiformis]|uniref:Uncharacterized protein n=1 Tax=Clavelina lepadiformis TaxID=159417 RepID=A0ABP0GBP4_CLALP
MRFLPRSRPLPVTVSTPRHSAVPQINYQLRSSTRGRGKHADDTRLPLETTPNEDAIGAVGRGGQTLNVGPITRFRTSPRKKRSRGGKLYRLPCTFTFSIPLRSHFLLSFVHDCYDATLIRAL